MYRILLVILFACNLSILLGQNVATLKKQREKIEDELRYIQMLLDKTKKDKTANLSKLQMLNYNIETKQKLIKHIGEEMALLNRSIKDETSQLVELEAKYKLLKKNYIQTSQHLYLRRSKENKLMFILASKDFNQAYRRFRYIRQYSLHVKNQAQKIADIKQKVDTRLSTIMHSQQEKSKLLNQVNNESLSLLSKKNQQEKYIDVLKDQEEKLKADLEKNKRLAKQLNERIHKLISKKVEDSKGKDGKIKLTISEEKLSGSFGNNKGRLPWPTSSGFISMPFGEHNHSVLRHVKVRNDGIDITTDKGAKCKAVFDGIVSEISNIPGLNNIIMIRHGKYLSVYINLKSILVKQGDRVRQGQLLGTVVTDYKENTTVLKFQLWEGFSKQNPAHWLKKL